MCKSVNIFVFWSDQCCAGALMIYRPCLAQRDAQQFVLKRTKSEILMSETVQKINK